MPWLTILVFLPCVFALVAAFLPKQTMVLGLDLQGGCYLLLQVNRQGVINDQLQELKRDAGNLLANQNGIGNLITVKKNALSIELTDPKQQQKADQLLQTLQNNVGGSVIGVGGTPELTFADMPDGKISVALTSDGIDQRILLIVALHQHGVKSCNASLPKLAGTLDQLRESIKDRRGISLGRWRLTRRQTHLARSHGKTSQRVQYQQNVLALLREMFCDAGCRQRRPHAQERRLVGCGHNHHRSSPPFFSQAFFEKLSYLAPALTHQPDNNHLRLAIASHHPNQRAFADTGAAEYSNPLAAADRQHSIDGPHTCS